MRAGIALASLLAALRLERAPDFFSSLVEIGAIADGPRAAGPADVRNVHASLSQAEAAASATKSAAGNATEANSTEPAAAANATVTTAAPDTSQVVEGAVADVADALGLTGGTEDPLPEQECNTNLLLSLEADWVLACFHWNAQDENLQSELRQWVDYTASSLTALGSAEVCVQGEPCITAVHAYYAGFVEEGCGERRNLESSYKLAHALETAADACVVVGPQAALNFTPPAVNVHGHPGTLEGCFHSYPDCAPQCLLLPSRAGIPGSQRLGELYYVHGTQGGTCYKATTRCQGCLMDAPANPDDLAPWNCPDIQCVEVPKYLEADAPLVAQGECSPQCLGHPPCGPDGCGGQCGVCADNESCVDDACVWRTFAERFEPKDERAMPEWYREERREESQASAADARAQTLEARLFPDFHRSTLASRLGLAP